MKRIAILAAVIFLISCGPTNNNVQTLKDGTYLLAEDSESGPNLLDIEFHPEFLEFNEESPKLRIDTSEYAPLILAQAPDTLNQPDNRKHLLLTLTPGAGDELSEFTGRNVGGRVAIVIGGMVVSQHKIRERIEGGKLQITRCTDNACEKIFYELEDNFTE
jgi:hypothetical protein